MWYTQQARHEHRRGGVPHLPRVDDVGSPSQASPEQHQEETQVVAEQTQHAAADGGKVADRHGRRLRQRPAVLGEQSQDVAEGEQVFRLFKKMDCAAPKVGQVVTGDHEDAHVRSGFLAAV